MYGQIQPYSTQSLIECLDKNKVPKVQENPPVYQMATRNTADRCFEILGKYSNWHTGFVGFDTETTVYRKSNPQVVSMIQIATRELCFLFQVFRITKINNSKFPPLLQQILTNKDIKKVGVNASGDADWIKKSYGFEMQGVINLESIAQQKGYAARSLAELTRMFGDPELVLEKTKKILKWNFDAAKLNVEIIRYASSDAFAGIQVYESILKDRINEEYINYEKLHPMSMKEEDDEIYSLISDSFPKGKDLKNKAIINYVESKYQRWTKTKPKTDDRHKAALGVIDRLIDDGRLIKVLDDNSDSNSDDETGDDFKIRLPGVSLDLILKIYGKKFFESKGLSSQDSEFMIEISSHCLKAIRKDSLAKIIVNNGKIISLDKKNREVVINKLNELNRKGALMSGHRWDTLLLHPGWLKELENGYEEYKLTHKEDEHVEDEHVEDERVEDERVEDERVEDEASKDDVSKDDDSKDDDSKDDDSKDDDSNDKNLEFTEYQNEQILEPWKDIDEYDPNDVWSKD